MIGSAPQRIAPAAFAMATGAVIVAAWLKYDRYERYTPYIAGSTRSGTCQPMRWLTAVTSEVTPALST